MKVDDLTLTKSLGKGAFGEVFLTKKDGSNCYYATKRLDRAHSEKPENQKRIVNEISLLMKINHPNIVRLTDLKKTKSHIYIVMEYCNGGDLSHCLKNYKLTHHRPFSEEIVQYLMRQIVDGLSFLHSKKIIHRDLKLDNILVTFNNKSDLQNLNMMKATIKIIDFGFATILKPQNANLTFTVLGTPSNMDPQLLQNMETRTRNVQGYDEKADIWSLGTLCYEMLTGHTPFSGKSMQELFQNVRTGTYSLPKQLSNEVVDFIEKMLQKEPKSRWSAEKLRYHDFLVKNVKQFHPVDVRNIPGLVGTGGGTINITSNFNQPKQKYNLGQTVWDIFASPEVMPPSQPQAPIVVQKPTAGYPYHQYTNVQYPQAGYQYTQPKIQYNYNIYSK